MRFNREPRRSRATGNQIEAATEQWLIEQGLRPIMRNYHCRQGEIDLVMQDGDYTVFIEVRFRRNSRHGEALATIDSAKQRKLVAAAQHFLGSHPSKQSQPLRIDAVGVTPMSNNPDRLIFNWVRNAITL